MNPDLKSGYPDLGFGYPDPGHRIRFLGRSTVLYNEDDEFAFIYLYYRSF